MGEVWDGSAVDLAAGACPAQGEASKRISRSRGHCSARLGCNHSVSDGGFGFGRCGPAGIQGIVVNPNLLVSINLQISPNAVSALGEEGSDQSPHQQICLLH